MYRTANEHQRKSWSIRRLYFASRASDDTTHQLAINRVRLANGERAPPRGAAPSAQPFIPVTAIPSMKYRWKRKKTNTVGRVMRTFAAIRNDQSLPVSK